jgi:hypothetical protein
MKSKFKINKIQIQDSSSSDEESTTVPPTKTAIVCELGQIPLEIWMTLPLEAKKWLLNERKRAHNEKETKNANMSKQYARVKDEAKGEDVIMDNKHQTYAFVDEFLEEGMKSSSLYEADEDANYEYWSSNHYAHTILRISNSLHKKCKYLLHLPEKYHISILDGGEDTCILE